MTKVTTRTFVAPAVGGPIDGKLIRLEEGLIRYTVPYVPAQGPLQFAVYDLITEPDGSRFWREVAT